MFPNAIFTAQTVTCYMKKLFTLALGLFLFLPVFGQAPLLEISFEVESISDSSHAVKLFLKGLEPDSLEVKAVNFSFAFQSECARLDSYQTYFTEAWTSMLERAYEKEAVDLSYDSLAYDRQAYYGIANPSAPGTQSLIVPGPPQEPKWVLTAIFTGSCSDRIHVESEEENGVNQQGDHLFNPIKYRLSRPKD